MNAGSSIRRRGVARATTVSAGALTLCMLSAGVAMASTPPLPTPSPDNVITTIDQTTTQVTNTVSGVTQQPTPQPATTPTSPVSSGSTSGGTSTGGTTTGSTGTSTTTTTKAPATVTHSATTQIARRPATLRHTTATSRGQAVAVVPADPGAPAFGALPATDAAPLNLPPATTMTAATGNAPAVAPLLLPQTTQHITPAAAMLEADKHAGSPARALVLGLAIAAAGGLAFEHLRQARRGLAG